jgi:ribA/ribD-fused uncharacterized protein
LGWAYGDLRYQKMNKIDSFTGDNFYLSNFYHSQVEYNGTTYKTSEHAYQAEKAADAASKRKVRQADTPGKAKRLGRVVTMRENWDNLKYNVMLEIVRAKFKQHPDLAEKLIATGSATLIEGNNWGDKLWGAVDGVGKNWLGKILMQVRYELYQQTKK